MKVILKPISHPRLGEISIVDDLFAIGRNEEPFASQLGEAAARLSRRHARLFQESGKVFLADLGSRNGTRVNERVLNNDVSVLASNDRITFGDAVEFRVEIQRAEQTVDKAPPVRLTLVPENPASGLDAIAIESFPLLVSRNEGEFEQYRERLPDAWRKLSRRHAVIALKGGRVSVEDLGSSNGTYVSGNKLDERARELADGDTIGFGDPLFSYKVRIENLHEPTQFAQTLVGRPEQFLAADAQQPAVAREAPQPVAIEQPPVAPEPSQRVAIQQPASVDPHAGANRTRFVSSADSFINVFCADDHHEAGKSADKAAKTLETQKLQPPPTGLRKFRHLFGQLLRALGGSGQVDRRLLWGAAALVGVIAVVVGITYVAGVGRQEIKDLLDEGRYAASASAGNRYLEHDPEDLDAKTWAEEALIKTVVPVWMEHIERGRFVDAEQYLAEQRAAHPHIQRGQQMIDTLAWAGKVEAHMADRGGPSGPIVLFRHEDLIRKLVQEWEVNSFRRQQIMDQIVNHEPRFEQMHARVFSSLTSLRSDNALYVKAIEDLKANIQTELKQGEQQDIEQLLNEFGSSYPSVTGIDALREDLRRFDMLYQLVQQQDLLQLVHLSRTAKFRTPVFAAHADAWLAKQLPPSEVIAKHSEAAAAWRAGNHDEAIATLQSVKNAAWGEVATRQIERYQKVGADYDALLASKGSDAYYDRLLVVWSSLRPNEDEHLIQTLEPDFIAHRDKVVPRLDQSLQRVRGYWSEYQSSGGIPGVVRVEERVSPRFSGQAKRLSSAYREISSGARTYQLLQITPPAEWQALQREVVDEVQRQRRWLQDLNLVLEPVLVRAKLDLLPEPLEQSLWVRSTTDQRKD